MHGQQQSSSIYWGKYREIVIAVTFFLIFDLAVLVLNFYVSYQLSDSAMEINLAGRQRMLSQRMTKELLIAEHDRIEQRDIGASAEAVAKTVTLFDQTLRAFRDGGEVMGGDGKPVRIRPVQQPEARDILAQTDALWHPLREHVATLAANPDNRYALQSAAEYARAHNLELLKLMNQLTTKLEQAANARADLLRQVQTGGIILALLNFVFILFKFLRRLRANDRKVEQAQNETTEILATVREGLFLLDHDFRIGSQYSASLAQILGRPISPGDDFRAVLAGMIPEEACKSACEYIGLLLGDRVKEALVQDLNPLVNMLVSVTSQQGVMQQRYLTLQFNRALQDGKVSHLLVTVFDVTAQMELEQQLASARKKSKAEMEVLLDLLKVDPATLRDYVGRAEQELMDINDRLRHLDGSRDYRRAINQIFRQIHALKGEAAMLGLEMFEELAHKFEVLLSDLRTKGTVTGQDLLALPLPLDEFLQRIHQVRELSQRLAALQGAFPGQNARPDLEQNLETLAARIAHDQGKQVELLTDLQLIGQLPPTQRTALGDIVIQLVRNAVAHGIETPAERLVQGKSPTGQVHVTVKREGRQVELLVRDDGRGLAPARIRSRLRQLGLYTDTQLQHLDDRQVIRAILEPGFSTAGTATRDAGHGVGLDIVSQKAAQLGSTLAIDSREQVYTQFSLKLSVDVEAVV